MESLVRGLQSWLVQKTCRFLRFASWLKRGFPAQWSDVNKLGLSNSYNGKRNHKGPNDHDLLFACVLIVFNCLGLLPSHLLNVTKDPSWSFCFCGPFLVPLLQCASLIATLFASYESEYSVLSMRSTSMARYKQEKQVQLDVILTHLIYTRVASQVWSCTLAC